MYISGSIYAITYTRSHIIDLCSYVLMFVHHKNGALSWKEVLHVWTFTVPLQDMFHCKHLL